MTDVGKILMITGLAIAALGALIWLIGHTGLPLGRLPGDIAIDRPNEHQRIAPSPAIRHIYITARHLHDDGVVSHSPIDGVLPGWDISEAKRELAGRCHGEFANCKTNQ